MSEIIFFNNKQESDPDNGLAKPYNKLRDWNERDERRRPEFKDLKGRYPEAFSQELTDAIIAEQRRAIYPEAYEKTHPKSKKRIAQAFHAIPTRVFEAIRKIAHPREMKAPSVGYIAGQKIKRARMPGVTRAEVRDILRNLLKYL